MHLERTPYRGSGTAEAFSQVNWLMSEVFTFGFDLRGCGPISVPPTGLSAASPHVGTPYAIAPDVSAETRGASALVPAAAAAGQRQART
jgi:hypothetical protein